MGKCYYSLKNVTDSDSQCYSKVHCVPCKVESSEEKTADWMDRDLWSEMLKMLEPTAESLLAEEQQQQPTAKDKKKTMTEAVTLEGDRLRLACVARRNPFDGLRVAHMQGQGQRTRLAVNGRKLVVGASLVSCTSASGEVSRAMHQAIGAKFDGEKISHYFASSSSSAVAQ